MPNSRRLALVALAGALAGALGLCLVAWRAEHALIGAWGFPLDDSWIHCQIARNLARGQGWAYNPGVPVQNSSGPLWTALLGLGFVVFGAGAWVAKALGALCFLGCVGFAWRLARTLTGDALAAALAAFLTATSASLLWHGLSGMETPLAALLVAATFETFYLWTVGRRRFAWVGLASLAVMTRPEALLLVPLLCGERWWRGRATPGARREVLLAVGLAALCLLPYFVLNLRLSGSLFPTTFAAKTAHTGLANALRHGDLREVLVSLSLYPYVWSVHAFGFWCRKNSLLVLAAALGIWAVARGPRRAFAPGLFLLALPALRGMAAPHEIPSIQQGRYLALSMPVVFACAAAGIGALLRSGVFTARPLRRVALIVVGLAVLSWLRLEWRLPHAEGDVLGALRGLVPWLHATVGLDSNAQNERLALCFAIVLSLVVVGLGFLRSSALRVAGIVVAGLALLLQLGGALRLPSLYARNVRNIHDMDIGLGQWVHAQVPEGTRVAVNDIGAIAYFGERPIVDAIGLATPELTPYLTPRRLRTLIAMRRLRPPVFVLFPTWFPEWTTRPSLLTPILRHHVDENTILGGSVSIVYQADWDRFGRYYSDALLEKLDPPDADASFAGHWRRGLANLALATRPRLFVVAGNVLRQRGDAAGAERSYRRAIGIDPQDEEGWKGLLEVFAARHDRALYGATLQEMMRALPNAPAPLEAWGDFQAASGQESEAARSFEAALELHPDNVRLLGKLEAYWGRQGDAARSHAYGARRQELERPGEARYGAPPAGW